MQIPLFRKGTSVSANADITGETEGPETPHTSSSKDTIQEEDEEEEGSTNTQNSTSHAPSAFKPPAVSILFSFYFKKTSSVNP